MNVATLRDRLIALSLLPFLTPNRTRLLLEYFDPVAEACNASATLLQALLSLTPEQAAQVRNPLTNVAPLRDHVVTIIDDDYPPLLKQIPDPPLALHFRGDRTLLARTSVAIVGSRRASPYGLNVAAQLARQLASAGVVVVSGLARGIDAAAHRAALDAGGTTIAILGTGIDTVYPRSNLRLYRRIAAEGLLLTELPPGAPPKPAHFPVRNRLISGISKGTVVVEAARRSGSLITARMAAEQNRDVFAVPGSIFSARSEGTHRLLQSGAKLVHDVGDVLEELPGTQRACEPEEKEPGSPLGEVLGVLTREEGTHVDAVAQRLGRTTDAIAASLLRLELDGWIRALPGARYVRVR